MDEEQLKNFCKAFGITQVPSDRNYWLIRTASGTYFNDFYTNNYVAIGWDKFSDINQMQSEKEDVLKQKIADTYKDEKRPGYVYNQIKRFMFEIKKGDMVLIPNENSSDIAFGVVSKEFYVRENISNIKDNTQQLFCTYKKCIDVKWIKVISKNSFEPYLRMLLFTHTTISNVEDYKDYINRTLYPIYLLDNQLHLTYAVQTAEDISFNNFTGFLNVVSSSLKMFDDVAGTDFYNSKIDIKTTVNSPGVIEIIGCVFAGGLGLVCLNSFLFGGKFDVDLLKFGKYSSEHSGVFGTILKFKEQKDKKEIEMRKIKNEYNIQKNALKLKAPNEINQKN